MQDILKIAAIKLTLKRILSREVLRKKNGYPDANTNWVILWNFHDQTWAGSFKRRTKKSLRLNTFKQNVMHHIAEIAAIKHSYFCAKRKETFCMDIFMLTPAVTCVGFSLSNLSSRFRKEREEKLQCAYLQKIRFITFVNLLRSNLHLYFRAKHEVQSCIDAFT